MLQLGVAWSFSWGLKPPKPHRGDGTVSIFCCCSSCTRPAQLFNLCAEPWVRCWFHQWCLLLSRPVTRGEGGRKKFATQGKMCWTSFKTVGHSSKIWAHLSKLCTPPGVSSWLQACFPVAYLEVWDSGGKIIRKGPTGQFRGGHQRTLRKHLRNGSESGVK